MKEFDLIEDYYLVIVRTIRLVDKESLVRVVVIFKVLCVFVHEILKLRTVSFQGK